WARGRLIRRTCGAPGRTRRRASTSTFRGLGLLGRSLRSCRLSRRPGSRRSWCLSAGSRSRSRGSRR
ncbi:hypothetical protein C0993_005088, partial [Termitomyces sp. T159_Od127]